MSQTWRFNGRFAKKKAIQKKLKATAALAIANLKRRNKQVIERNKMIEENSICHGTRLVEMNELGKYLKCIHCNELLSLENIIKEQRHGLASIFDIPCKKCSTINQVPTSKFHINKNNRKVADINSTIVLGSVHAGVGCTVLNKLLSCANVPQIKESLFKRYEREIGPMIEEAAKRTCQMAAEEERKLVLEKIKELCTTLSEEIKEEIYPLYTSICTTLGDDSNNNNTENEDERQKKLDAILGQVVNILVSYDMAWSKRGNGKSYDSLNGYGAIIGFLSGKVLDFASRHRKCNLCERGHLKGDHDCRLNFKGSAKAMEPSVGADLVNNSEILKEANVKVRVVIGDDDSATIAAVRQGNLQHIFKLSDSNHLNKHFVSDLYALKSSFSEMRSKEVIPHLKKCFTYVVQQNRGKTVELASILRSIPYHGFGQHDNCKHWCQRKDSSDPSQKQTILLKDANLQMKLHEIFEKYASNASKFSIAASSQSNESLHNIMAHKSPKNNCYCLSESSDYRLASAVATKNDGDKYLLDVKKKLSIVPGNHTAAYAAKLQSKRTHRAMKSKLPASKKRRHELTLKREALRKKNEGSEGIQYQPNYGMQKAVEDLTFDPQNIVEKLPFITLSEQTCNFGYFDLETSGFRRTADILQIACKIENKEFNVYINPIQPIKLDAFEATGLQNINGVLYHDGQQVNSIPIDEALIEFCKFLNSSLKPCLLIAHNCKFDSAHLIRAIIKHSMVQDFSNIAGFVDSYYQLKKLFPERNGKGALNFSN